MDFFSSFPSCVLSPTGINIMKRLSYLVCPHMFVFLLGKRLFFFDHASDPMLARSARASAKRAQKNKLSPTPSPYVLARVSHTPGLYFAKLTISTNSRQNRGSVDRLLASTFTSHNTRTQNTYRPQPSISGSPKPQDISNPLSDRVDHWETRRT